jgi:hypothetical protein
MNDWTTALKALAPTVASALLGPLGGVAVAALGSLMGVTEATQDKIAAAIQGGQLTPEMVGEIRKLELQYKNEEAERGFKYAELEFKDIDSARRMAVDTRSNTPTVLSYGVLIGGGAMMASVLMGWAVADTVLAGTLIGYAVSEMKQVLQYWFGSSRSSSVKTDLIAMSPPPNT